MCRGLNEKRNKHELKGGFWKEMKMFRKEYGIINQGEKGLKAHFHFF
jgi:hypothetical protein